MPIALFSGLPGAGKTAQLVAEIVRLKEESPDRVIYAHGINGLKEGLAIPLTEEMLHKWWELPPGSIICIDECQEDGSTPGSISLFPKDRGVPASWVQHISKVRHYGMDFLLTTQDPCNMSAYVRRLVDKHVLTVRKFGTQVVQRYTWGRCIDDPYSRREQKNAVSDVGTLPSKVFELYKSSQLHTMKRRIPMKLYLLGAVIVVTVAAIVAVPLVLHRFQKQSVDGITAASGAKPGASLKGGTEDASLRHTDIAKWMRPRVAGVPWSAPMFDKLEVQAQPRLFCIAVDDGRCSCNTEQGTKYEVPLAQCRKIVSDGLYNPFIAPSSRSDGPGQGDHVADQGARQEAASPPAGRPGPSSVDYVDPSSDAWKASPLAAAYVPPELMVRPSYTPSKL